MGYAYNVSRDLLDKLKKDIADLGGRKVTFTEQVEYDDDESPYDEETENDG